MTPGAEARAVAAATAAAWPNGRRPKFWSDLAVRTLLTAAHRQMTIEEARAACAERFGPARTPSKSAVHRYWRRLDDIADEQRRAAR